MNTSVAFTFHESDGDCVQSYLRILFYRVPPFVEIFLLKSVNVFGSYTVSSFLISLVEPGKRPGYMRNSRYNVLLILKK